MADAPETIIRSLEKATGPDRNIDAAIQRMLGGRVMHIGAGGKTNAFTASVDAALSVVPDGWRTNWAGTVPMATQWFWELIAMHENKATDRVYAATAPLAICIVALKARQVS